MADVYDYAKQAWVRDGHYVRCGHPLVQDCRCFGRLHAGEPVHLHHTEDSDCTVDLSTDLCLVCGVLHGDPCPECRGRGFHAEDCSCLTQDDEQPVAFDSNVCFPMD